jgi:hypothetical protein
MATGKKLKDIAIIPAPGKVGVSFIFEDSPTEHFLLSAEIAEQFSEKLMHGVVIAKQAPRASLSQGQSVPVPPMQPVGREPARIMGRASGAPGDGMGLSDYSSMSIVTPKKEH